MIKAATEWIPKGLSGREQPYISILNYRTLETTKTGIKKQVLHGEGVIRRTLCASCEAHLHGGENYVRKVLYGDGPTMVHTKCRRLKLRYRETPEGWSSVTGVEERFVDYTLFKQFQLGVLWRCSIATGGIFTDLQIDAGLQEKMRSSLFEPVPSARLAPCYMEKMIGIEPVWIESLGFPQMNGGDFEIIMGGFRWFYRLTANCEDMLFLSADGRLYNTVTNADLHEQRRPL